MGVLDSKIAEFREGNLKFERVITEMNNKFHGITPEEWNKKRAERENRRN